MRVFLGLFLLNALLVMANVYAESWAAAAFSWLICLLLLTFIHAESVKP